MRQIVKIIVFLCLPVLFSSCGTAQYEWSRNVKVHGTPDTDFYVKKQWSFAYSDGFEKLGASEDVSIICKENHKYVGSTDSTGNGVLTLSAQEYKRSKKRVTAVKSGYEATGFKIKRTINTGYLLDILFPVALFFDHYTTLSKKKTNYANLVNKSPYSCFEYFEMAGNQSKRDDMIDYYQKAADQDYRNENGVRALALNNIGIIYGESGNTHLAFLYLKKAKNIDPNCGAEDNIEWLKGIVNGQNRVAEEKKQRWEQRMATLTAVADGLNSIGNTVGQVSGQTSDSSYGSPVTADLSSGAKKASDSNSDKNVKWMQSNYQTMKTTYGNYETQLVKMKTYPEQYNNSQRIDIQTKMRDIRQKITSHGGTCSKSSMEDWRL